MSLNPKLCSAGIAGILTGVALAGKFIFFVMSGFNPLVLDDPAAGLVLLQESGVYTKPTWRAMEALQMHKDERDIEVGMTDASPQLTYFKPSEPTQPLSLSSCTQSDM